MDTSSHVFLIQTQLNVRIPRRILNRNLTIMVARYKKKRLAEEWSHDSPPKHLNLEGAERQRAKREAQQGLKDTDHEIVDLAKLKADDEESYEKDYECYLKSKADPNYKCTCFKKDIL